MSEVLIGIMHKKNKTGPRVGVIPNSGARQPPTGPGERQAHFY